MAFVVEDGTGVADANSGVDVEYADSYFLDRGVVAWTGNTPAKQSALIQATDYVEYRFATRFAGEKEFPDAPQPLSFPRTILKATSASYGYGYAGNPIIALGQAEIVSIGMPVGYKRAICEYALRALSSPLAPDPVVSNTGRAVISESHKIGPITDTIAYSEYGPGSLAQAFKPYPAADALLVSLFKSNSGLLR